MNDLEKTEVLIPTEYRIIPIIIEPVVFYFLQFRHVYRHKKRRWWFGKEEEKVDISWRFVFKNEDGVYDCLYPGNCPSNINFTSHYRLVNSYDFNQDELHRFARNWPFIEDYYAQSRFNRAKREADRAAERERAKIIYINPKPTKPENAGIHDDNF